MDLELITKLTDRDVADGIEQQVVGAVVLRGDKVLLLRRHAGDFRGGTWELPSGKVDPGEDLASALNREVREETALEVVYCLGYLGSFDYRSFSGRSSRQHTFVVTAGEGDVVLTEHDRYVWSPPAVEEQVSDEVRALLQRPEVRSGTGCATRSGGRVV